MLKKSAIPPHDKIIWPPLNISMDIYVLTLQTGEIMYTL